MTEETNVTTTPMQPVASQFLNAIGEEIPCDLGCPADRALDCSGPAQSFVGNGRVDLFLYGSQAVFILGNQRQSL